MTTLPSSIDTLGTVQLTTQYETPVDTTQLSHALTFAFWLTRLQLASEGGPGIENTTESAEEVRGRFEKYRSETEEWLKSLAELNNSSDISDFQDKAKTVKEQGENVLLEYRNAISDVYAKSAKYATEKEFLWGIDIVQASFQSLKYGRPTEHKDLYEFAGVAGRAIDTLQSKITLLETKRDDDRKALEKFNEQIGRNTVDSKDDL